VQKNPEGGGKITISSTIYITGKAANKSNEELYNKKATELYKSGTYTNKAGEKFEVVYEVKFEYVSDKSKIELKDGDNILEYNENVGRSGVNGTYNADIDRKGNISNVKRFTGNSGEIAKGDESDHNATIHETLHFVGLSDRYDDIGTESLPDDGFKNDILGSYEGTELNQVHYDNYGETYSTKESGTYTLKERVDTKSSDGSIKGGSSDGKRPIKEAEKK